MCEVEEVVKNRSVCVGATNQCRSVFEVEEVVKNRFVCVSVNVRGGRGGQEQVCQCQYRSMCEAVEVVKNKFVCVSVNV